MSAMDRRWSTVRGWAFASLIALVACGGSAPAESAGTTGAEEPPAPAPREIAFAPYTGERVDASYTLLDAWHGDVDGRIVELHVNAEQDGSGRTLWEHGHSWLLLVRAGDRSARLVDDFIPNGTLRFWVVDAPDRGTVIVTQMDSGTAGVRATEWSFSPERDGWVADRRVEVVGSLLHRTESAVFR